MCLQLLPCLSIWRRYVTAFGAVNGHLVHWKDLAFFCGLVVFLAFIKTLEIVSAERPCEPKRGLLNLESFGRICRKDSRKCFLLSDDIDCLEWPCAFIDE